MKHGKKYMETAKAVDRTKLYDPDEAIALVKKTAVAKFDEAFISSETSKSSNKPFLRISFILLSLFSSFRIFQKTMCLIII